MSSASNVIGASKHNGRNEWNGAFAFTNIGLPGAAFEGKEWNKRTPVKTKLKAIFSELLMTKERPQGIFLCEVGNRDDPISLGGKERL